MADALVSDDKHVEKAPVEDGNIFLSAEKLGAKDAKPDGDIKSVKSGDSLKKKVSEKSSLNGTENGKSASAHPEQLELMVLKDGVPPVRDEREFNDGVLDLGCNCAKSSTRMGYVVMIVMLLSNMLNYMDRFTIVGVLKDVQAYYNINNAEVGLMQTMFIIMYMLFSLVFGYVGDRFNRKVTISIGIFSWSAAMFASSFVGPDYFVLFVFLRSLVGVGEGCYSTIAPTIIADLFADSTRTMALSVFYMAIPVGSGLGYIVGAYVAEMMGSWQWALRATPVLGAACTVLTLLLVKEPPRGASEGGTHLKATSWKADIIYLVKHKSFMLSSAAFTCVSFVAGALAFWAPLYVYKSMLVHPMAANDAQVSLIFGVITCMAGFSGVAFGTLAASRLRRQTPRADPLVCAFGMITGAPFLLLSLALSRYNLVATWICIFCGETLLSLNWALVTDILLYIVIPTRRSSAEAVQILMSHALGDAGSPYIVGLIADALVLYGGHQDSVIDYSSLQYALFMTCFVCVLGGGFFLATALYVHEDRLAANRATQGGAIVTIVNGSDGTHEVIDTLSEKKMKQGTI